MREVNPDYGIDLEIEVWEDSNPADEQRSALPTGRTLHIQLKHQIDFYYSTTFCKCARLQLKVSTIEYLYQRDNSFIVVNTGNKSKNHFSIIRVKELKEIYIDKLATTSGKTLIVPLFYERPMESDIYYLWADIISPRKRFYNILGDTFDQQKNNIDIQRATAYYLLHESEDNFWKREMYAIAGLYDSLHSKTRKVLTERLVDQFELEDKWGKLGILEALDYLGYRDKITFNYAKSLMQSSHPGEVLMALNFLAMPNDESQLEYIDSIFCNPLNNEVIRHFEEWKSAEKIAAKGFRIIGTEKSFDYLLGSFVSDSYLIKPELRWSLAQSLQIMVEQNINWTEKAMQKLADLPINAIMQKKDKSDIKDYIEAAYDYFYEKYVAES